MYQFSSTKTVTVVALLGLAVSSCAGPQPQAGRLGSHEPSGHAVGAAEQRRGTLPVLDNEAGLADYLAYAALNNPGLEAAFNHWTAALEQVDQVTALPDPRLSYTYFITEVETRVGPQRQKVSLSQKFPWLGKLELRGEAAGAQAEAARYRYEQIKLELFHKVRHAYYEYYYLGRAIAVTQENLVLLGSIEEVARSKYQSGGIHQAAVLKFQVDMGKLGDRLRSLQDMQEPTVARLNAALNRPMDEPLAWPSDIAEQEVALSDEDLGDALRENNPQLAGLDRQIDAAKHKLALAQKDYYPDISLGVLFIDTREAVMPVDDSGNDPLAVTLSLNLPLNHGKYRAGERQARAQQHAAALQRVDRENNLRAELQLALYAVRDAQRRMDLYEDELIPKAQQSYSVTQQAFSAGNAEYLDVVDAVRTLLEFQLAQERARVDRAQELSKIELLVGKPLDRIKSD